MAALGHALTPFCFVICQYLGLLPSQVHALIRLVYICYIM